VVPDQNAEFASCSGWSVEAALDFAEWAIDGEVLGVHRWRAVNRERGFESQEGSATLEFAIGEVVVALFE
jgi:hypothetical protein